MWLLSENRLTDVVISFNCSKGSGGGAFLSDMVTQEPVAVSCCWGWITSRACGFVLIGRLLPVGELLSLEQDTVCCSFSGGDFLRGIDCAACTVVSVVQTVELVGERQRTVSVTSGSTLKFRGDSDNRRAVLYSTVKDAVWSSRSCSC